MSASTTLASPLGPHEQALAQYRTVSKAALLALGLGLASPLVLVNPLLSPVPLLAIAVSVIALRGIGRSEGQVIGRAPAVAGMCLAAFFLGWGISQRFSRELALENHARQFAESWLTLVAQGKLQQAHQLRIDAHSRIRSVEVRREFYEKNSEAADNLRTFFSNPGLKEFVAEGPSVKFQFDSQAGSERTEGEDMLVLKYTFQAAGADRPLWITIKRKRDADGFVDWSIHSVTGEAATGS